MSFNIQNVVIGGQEPFFLLGPCSLENEAFAWEMATAIKEICTRLGVQFIFKASYDKANRTSVKSFREVNEISQGGDAKMADSPLVRDFGLAF